MKRPRRRITQGVGWLIAVVALMVGFPCLAQEPTPAAGRTVTCAFSHPAYSGWCRVTQNLPKGTPPARLCNSILACLNDARCSKTYCNATTIRGGWKLEEVKTGRKAN